jgi:NAD(P)-dependent dehydrogenase (short-subunit alcohol dehydrogenase family)
MSAVVGDLKSRYPRARLVFLGHSRGTVSASYVARDMIRCNSVHPGPIVTDMIKDMLENKASWEQRLRRLPMGRAGTPEEVAYGVLFLASDESSYVTGSEAARPRNEPRRG